MTGSATALQLDGRIAGQWVDLLRASCERVFQNEGRLILDLSGVSFADHDGVELLRRLEQLQVSFINCSPFLLEQIKYSANQGPPNL
jgi:anti-anti-sigma regulatory factor